MTNRQIETSREIRLWITGIIGPVIIGGATLIASDSELRREVTECLKRKIQTIKNKFKKKEEKNG